MDDNNVLSQILREFKATEGSELRSYRIRRGEQDLQVTIFDNGLDNPAARYEVEVREVGNTSRSKPYKYGNARATIEQALVAASWPFYG